MERLLIISNEPALGETLAGELPDLRIEQVRADASTAETPQGDFRMILSDDEGSRMHAFLSAAHVPVIRLSRPIRLSELLYTIRSQLQGKSAAPREAMPLSEGVILLPAERVLRVRDGQMRMALTEKEAELLLCLLEKRGQSIAREALLKRVWGYHDDVATRTLETHIYRLRGKLRQADAALDIVFSEEGGYALCLP